MTDSGCLARRWVEGHGSKGGDRRKTTRHRVVVDARCQAVAARRRPVSNHGQHGLGRSRWQFTRGLTARNRRGICHKLIHGEPDREIAQVGIPVGIGTAHVVRIGAAIDEAGDGRGVTRSPMTSKTEVI